MAMSLVDQLRDVLSDVEALVFDLEAANERVAELE